MSIKKPSIVVDYTKSLHIKPSSYPRLRTPENRKLLIERLAYIAEDAAERRQRLTREKLLDARMHLVFGHKDLALTEMRSASSNLKQKRMFETAERLDSLQSEIEAAF